jgi:hypothetical protein
VAAKELRCWTDGSSGHEWQEGMVITGPDQHPEQVLETDPALRLVTLDGEVRDYSWKNGPPQGVDYRDVKIHVVNYQGQYDPFTIADIDGGDVYSGEVTDYSVFPSWNHWPVAQMPSDGRYAKHPDRTAHSSLTHVRGPLQQGDNPDRPFQRMFMLEGLSTKTPEALIKLARSWLHAPDIEARSGCKCFGYDRAKREYPLVAFNDTMTVTIQASPERPLVNVCFGVRNWGGRGAAEVRVNGRKVSEMRQGAFVDTDGTDTMILWVELETSALAEFAIGGARPSPDYVATPYLVELTSALAKPVERPSPRPQPIRPQPIPRPREVIAEGEPVIAWNPSKEFHGKTVVEFDQIAKLRVAQSMTWSAWFRTGQGGTIMALSGSPTTTSRNRPISPGISGTFACTTMP